ncbi:MAG TPA: GNAT family protein [Steroidobacteraceae bacterium]|jgi:RimJ/RimL family protein N-acetyltransferase|nr:GNAT family protein [Steroidobacteraceae bacterium]
MTTLTDGVITLRPLERTDRDAIFAAVSESIAEISPWLPWCHPAYAPTETAAFIESSIQWWAQRSQFVFGIFDAVHGTYIGGTGVNQLNAQHRYANIGYWVRTSRTGRGFAPRALRLAARFAFDTLGLQRVEIAAEPENYASRRVAEKAGAKLDGLARNRIFKRGRPCPAALYSLIPEDLIDPPALSARPSTPEIL